MKNLNERLEGSRLYASEVLGLDEANSKLWAERELADFLRHVMTGPMGVANQADVEAHAEALLQNGYVYPPPTPA